MATEKSTGSNGIVKKILLGFVLTLAGISFFLAQSVIWVNNTVFDKETFVAITTEVVTRQDSRDAIAQVIVEEAFKNRPVASRLLGDRAVTFVSGLLGSDISERILERTAGTTYGYLTSPNRQDIALDLSAITEPLAAIVSFSESRGREVNFDPSSIPEKITLVNSDELPDINSYIQKLLIAGPLLWLTTAGLFAIYIFSGRVNRIRRFYYSLLTVAVVAIIALFTGPFVPSAIASYVSNIQLRGIVGDLTSAYLAPFYQQMYISLAVVSLAALTMRFHWIFAHAWNAAYAAVSSRTKTAKAPIKASAKRTKSKTKKR